MGYFMIIIFLGLVISSSNASANLSDFPFGSGTNMSRSTHSNSRGSIRGGKTGFVQPSKPYANRQNRPRKKPRVKDQVFTSLDPLNKLKERVYSRKANASFFNSDFDDYSSFLDGLWRSGNLPLWYAAQIICMFLHSFLMAPAAAFLYGTGLIKDVKNLFRLSGRRLWTNSMVAGGFAAFYLFDHYALSQVYFAFLALFFMNLLAVDALELIKGKRAGKRLAVFAGAAVITTAFMYTNYIGSGARFLARNLGIIEKYPYNAVVTADDQQAMEFLRENSRENALFATNRIHADPYKKDGISNIYSALSGRQGYMEGYAYALTNMGVPYYVIDQRLAVNRTLFSADTPADEVQRLRQTAGITHLIFSRQFEGSEQVISRVFEKIYDGDNVRIYSTGVRPLENHPLYQEQLAEYAGKQN